MASLVGEPVLWGFFIFSLQPLAGGAVLLFLGIRGLKSVNEHNVKVDKFYIENPELKKQLEKPKPKPVSPAQPQVVQQTQPAPLKTAVVEYGINGTQGMLYELDGGVTNILRVFEDRCVLVAKTTARSFVAGAFFNGTKEFFYDDLTSVQFREATKTFNGYIQFNFPGAVNISTSSFGGSGNNYNSENSFIFGTSLDTDASHSHEEKIITSN